MVNYQLRVNRNVNSLTHTTSTLIYYSFLHLLRNLHDALIGFDCAKFDVFRPFFVSFAHLSAASLHVHLHFNCDNESRKSQVCFVSTNNLLCIHGDVSEVVNPLNLNRIVIASVVFSTCAPSYVHREVLFCWARSFGSLWNVLCIKLVVADLFFLFLFIDVHLSWSRLHI